MPRAQTQTETIAGRLLAALARLSPRRPSEKMKIKIFTFVFIVIGISVFGQYGNLLGTRPTRTPTPEEIQQDNLQKKIHNLNGHIFRKVDGEIHNFLTDGEILIGQVKLIQNGNIIAIYMDRLTKAIIYFAVKNFGSATFGQIINVCAIRTGTYMYGESPIKLYDCGKLLTPEEEKQQLDLVNQARQKAAQEKMADQKIREFLIQSNSLNQIKISATNGIASSQYSLGGSLSQRHRL